MILIIKDKKLSVSGTEKTIEKIVKKIKDSNMEIDVASFEDLELFIEKGNVQAELCGKNLKEYSTVFFRRVGEKRNLAFIVANICQKLGINFIDKLYLNTNEASKLKQTTFLALNGVTVPKTYFAGTYSKKEIKKAIDFLNLPVVVKLSKGKKGQGVFLAKNETELEEILNNNREEEIFLQEFISNKFDYRILILGDQIACGEKRTRIVENEFRNNVYLGATEEFINVKGLDNNIQELAILAAKVANIQVAGVDIVSGEDGKAFVFEVNRAPAFTYDENISPELNLLTEYLIKCEKEK
jgi:RimK family alpha-L-glutamate ligase